MNSLVPDGKENGNEFWHFSAITPHSVYFCNLLKPQVVPPPRCEQSLCCRAVPDAAPGDVGGGGGSRSELVITWEVSDQSYVLLHY